MDEIFRYTLCMNTDIHDVPIDRLRAGRALSDAIDIAMRKGLVRNYFEIAAHMGFNRTNIAHHKKGSRPMSRRVVLEYATVLQCDPVAIADDGVRMELAEDLKRFESDAEAYAIIKEFGANSNRTPIKIPKDLLPADDADAGQLVTIRLHDEHDTTSNSFVIAREHTAMPVISGLAHVLVQNRCAYIAKIVEDRGGYIITPENGKPSTFHTPEELERAGVTIVGAVQWRLVRG